MKFSLTKTNNYDKIGLYDKYIDLLCKVVLRSKNMEKKIIVSDFDDTLYVNRKIDNNDIKSIDKFMNDGNLFVIATGSSYTSFLRKVGNANLKYDYLIVNHGSTILKNDEIIFNQVLDKTVLNEIINRYNLINKKNYTVIKNTKGNFFSKAKEGLVTPEEENITKIHLEFSLEDYEKEVSYLKKRYEGKCNIYEIGFNKIEIISCDSSKLLAIDKIINLKNISNQNVYTIGDGHSDLEMIKKYNGYCMKNSFPELKKYCIKEVDNVSRLIKDIR